MWRVERGYMPGIYNVYDAEGNPVAIDCTKDRAMLIAVAPEMLEALRDAEYSLVCLIRRLGDEEKNNENLRNVRATIAKVEGKGERK